jgi:hypothetical protein
MFLTRRKDMSQYVTRLKSLIEERKQIEVKKRSLQSSIFVTIKKLVESLATIAEESGYKLMMVKPSFFGWPATYTSRELVEYKDVEDGQLKDYVWHLEHELEKMDYGESSPLELNFYFVKDRKAIELKISAENELKAMVSWLYVEDDGHLQEFFGLREVYELFKSVYSLRPDSSKISEIAKRNEIKRKFFEAKEISVEAMEGQLRGILEEYEKIPVESLERHVKW